MAKFCFDIDGVINANPAAISWLTYHLLKDENGHVIYILSWRDGSNEERKAQTIKELERFNIYYDELIFAPRKFVNMRQVAFWKISMVHKLGINVWLDDELKIYRRDYGINLEVLLPNVIKIWI